jgi:hypothetical protein
MKQTYVDSCKHPQSMVRLYNLHPWLTCLIVALQRTTTRGRQWAERVLFAYSFLALHVWWRMSPLYTRIRPAADGRPFAKHSIDLSAEFPGFSVHADVRIWAY